MWVYNELLYTHSVMLIGLRYSPTICELILFQPSALW